MGGGYRRRTHLTRPFARHPRRLKGGEGCEPYSFSISPLPPKSFGKSLNFGSPSFIGRTVSW